MAEEDELDHCDCADDLERHRRVEAASNGQFEEGSFWAALFGTGTKAPTRQIQEQDQSCNEACVPVNVGPSRCSRGGYRAGDGGHYKVPVDSWAAQGGYGPGQSGYGPGKGEFGPGGGPGETGGYGPGGGPGQGGYGRGGFGKDGYGPGGYDTGRGGYGPGQAGGRRRGSSGYGPGKRGHGPGQGGYGRSRGRHGRGQYGTDAEGADGGVDGEGNRKTASDFLIPIIGGGLLFLTLLALLNRQFDVGSVVKSAAKEVRKQIISSLCDTNEKGSGSFTGISGGTGGRGIGGGAIGSGGVGRPGGSSSRSPCSHESESKQKSPKTDKNNPCGNLKVRIHPGKRKYQDSPNLDTGGGITSQFPTIPGLHDCEDRNEEENPEEGVFGDPSIR